MESTDPVSIVRAAEHDLPEAVAIMVEYLKLVGEFETSAATESEILQHTSDDDAALFVARSSKEIVGCVAVHRLPALADTFEIKRLYVVPAARGMGLAARLMRSAEAHAKARGARSMALDTKETMVEARRLYESFGYRAIPRYHDHPDIHLFLGKEL